MFFENQTSDGEIILKIEYSEFKFLTNIVAEYIKQNMQEFPLERLKEICGFHDEMEKILNYYHSDDSGL